MKIKALIRIIIWLLVSVILTSVFALALMGQFENLTRRMGFLQYDDAGYTAGNGIIEDFGAVTGINIEWVIGTVTVQTNVDDVIEISESSVKGLDDWQYLRYRLKDGVLDIKYTAPKMYEFWKIAPSKKLVLSIPASLIKNLDDVNVSSVAGNVEIKSALSDSLNVETVSGKIKLTNAAGKDMKVSSVSGGIELDFPSVEGVMLEFDTASGEIKNKIEKMSKRQDGTYVFGNGEYKCSVKTDVGNLEVTM